MFGEYLVNAQGEDVVAESVLPNPSGNGRGNAKSLPAIEELRDRLEKHYLESRILSSP